MLNPELSSKIAAWYKTLESPTAPQHLLRCMIGGKAKLKKGFPSIYHHTYFNLYYGIVGIAIWDADNRTIIGRRICTSLQVDREEAKEIQAAFDQAWSSRDIFLDKDKISKYDAFRNEEIGNNEDVSVNTKTV
jgi:hypothetical protein